MAETYQWDAPSRCPMPALSQKILLCCSRQAVLAAKYYLVYSRHCQLYWQAGLLQHSSRCRGTARASGMQKKHCMCNGTRTGLYTHGNFHVGLPANLC